MNSGFMQKEMGLTKYIVDKVSGKFDIDSRYENMENVDSFHPVEVSSYLITYETYC